MATTKTTKKITLPRVHKKWYDFKIDPKTLRPVKFSWELASGTKEVFLYRSAESAEPINAKIRNRLQSYYFVFDKNNKRIFAYPIQMVGHQTRSSCETAHYEEINSYSFYMFDENKQIWEIVKQKYQKYTGYDWHNRRSLYTTIEAKPRKISRLSTYYYNIQCQSTAHIRAMFSELYGNDFVYQNKLITDDNIRSLHYNWIYWLQTKGRKYSEKTIKATDELMNKISSDSRTKTTMDIRNSNAIDVHLESVDGLPVLSYYSKNKETFRQIFNNKTHKLDNFIWKENKWQKTGKLSEWQTISKIHIDETYKKQNSYDYTFIKEANIYYHNRTDVQRNRYWYSPDRSLYESILKYLSYPVIHQILQIQNADTRKTFYNDNCDVSKLYGKIPNKGKTLFAKLGVNKYQFNKPHVIVYMKWLLDTTNISYIDNDTWDKVTAVFTGVSINSYRDRDIKDFLYSRGEFTIDRWINICQLDKSDREQNMAVGGYYHGGIKQLYADYYKSLSAMAEFGMDISAYPIVFNNKQQLHRYHDEAARAVSSIQNRAQDEKFEMLYNKRIKMLENDGTHMITMPKSSSDLVKEGSYLHHCVGGYVNSVANGNTAIYFLRQSSDPCTPWLTVEVANKQCRQIHGACNAWMGSKDEYFNAVPFLVWWFEKHDITYNENLLTNMATGYCQASNRRNLPVDKIEAYNQWQKNRKSL